MCCHFETIVWKSETDENKFDQLVKLHVALTNTPIQKWYFGSNQQWSSSIYDHQLKSKTPYLIHVVFLVVCFTYCAFQ